MSTQEKYMPRFLKTYREEIIPKMKEKFGYTNDMAVPRLLKIVVNMGVGRATADSKLLEKLASELAIITGQKAKR